ncbi:MAG: shikimate kinase [Alphaproteobacteria bacterium]|jgi:shikimate kinase|nr:shikimate kinase [Alphaproteobacteria bacterium]
MGADTTLLGNSRQNKTHYADRTIALVGLMGAGKSTVGKRLAEALGREFYDSDAEIEKAAGLSISDIFAIHGENEFRRGERRVLERLLGETPHVLATGGGAYLDPSTRDLLREKAVTVWLNADLETLWNRVSRRNTRPLLRDPDPKGVLQRLFDEREPIYAQADLSVRSHDGPHDRTVRDILAALESWRPA